ncbi:hypothetical protein ACHAQE_011258, partial [Botrytis cinerea]
TYAPQAEIQQYFEGFALKYQLDKSTTFNTEIVSATWDDSRLLWFVQTQDSKSSSQKIWCCNVVGEISLLAGPASSLLSFPNRCNADRMASLSRLLELFEIIIYAEINVCQLVSAAGAFGMPKKADIAGLKTFKGEQWHLGSWPKDADLKKQICSSHWNRAIRRTSHSEYLS